MNLPDFLVEVPFGDIRLAGHRISLYFVVSSYNQGHSAEEIHEEFPSLPLDLIQKVIGFYLENRAEVDAFVAEYEAEIERALAEVKPVDLEELLRRRPDLARLRKP